MNALDRVLWISGILCCHFRIERNSSITSDIGRTATTLFAMKILCLHGRGSNNEIFRAQTAAFRADLDDFEWTFVQATVRHTEGNWSLYTSQFSHLPLYTYYNPFNPASILQTHDDLAQIIAEEGPFDGVLGYSGGAALAAEILAQAAYDDPFAMERPFQFAVFINGASPLRCFAMEDAQVMDDIVVDTAPMTEQAENMFLRPSALRKKDGVSDQDQVDHAELLSLLRSFKGKKLVDGTMFLSNGTHGLCRWEPSPDGAPLIDIPTLHIRSTESDDSNPHEGLQLLRLCDPDQAREFHHGSGHDFPRGRKEMKHIARLIREVAEATTSL
jgi:hypothetical protein